MPGVAAIGHVSPLGGGPNNYYGLDFRSAGLAWTAALCALDSDGDGQTNGLELGDPCCTWKDGGPPPQFGSDISHPGLASSKTSRAFPSCAPTPSPSPSSAPNNTSPSSTPAPAPAPTSDSSNAVPPLVVPLAAGGGTLLVFALLLFLAYFYCGSSKTNSARQPKSVLVVPEYNELAESPL